MADDPSAAWREDALRASAANTRRLMEAVSADGFVEWGESMQLSAAFAAQLGVSTDAPRASFMARVHPAHRTLFTQGIEAHRRDARAFDLEVALAVSDAGWRRFRCRAESHRDAEGEPRRTLLAFTDVTALRRAEECRQAAEARIEALEVELAAARRSPPPRPATPPSAPVEPRGAAKLPEGLRQALGAVELAVEALPEVDPHVGSQLGGLAEALSGAARPPDDGLEKALDAVAELHEDLALTALNAQLEALRLGQSGAGLAAVAGRMKQLAKSAAAATETFAELVRTERDKHQQWARSAARMGEEAARHAAQPRPQLAPLRAAVKAAVAFRKLS